MSGNVHQDNYDKLKTTSRIWSNTAKDGSGTYLIPIVDSDGQHSTVLHPANASTVYNTIQEKEYQVGGHSSYFKNIKQDQNNHSYYTK